MANNYYNFTVPFIPGTKVRSEPVNTEYSGVEAGFDLLPTNNLALVLGTATFAVDTQGATVNEYLITMPDAPSAYVDGMTYTFFATHTNDGPVTMNVDGLGVISAVSHDHRVFTGGEITTGLLYEFSFDDDNTQFVLAQGIDAAAQVGYAEEWAINPVDDPVSIPAGGDDLTTFSSLHWASGSASWATEAIDVLIPTNFGGNGATDFSATHWSGGAQAWATDAIDSLISTTFGGDGATDFSATHWSGGAQSWATAPIDALISTTFGGDGATDYSATHWSGGAQSWATELAGVLIPTNFGGDGATDFSATHWSVGAENWAIRAEDDAIPTIFGGDAVTDFSSFHWAQKAMAAALGYFRLVSTNSVIGVGDAGNSNTGDGVFLGGNLAGDVNIADNVIAIGVNALAVAAQLDFAGSIAIGVNAGALLDDTRDPWVIIGNNAVGSLTGGSFHDGNTVIGTNALGALDTTNIQGNTVIGHDVCADMTGAAGLGVIASSTVIGFDAGRGNVGASISNSVLIGRAACGDMGVGGVSGSVVIGLNAGESFGGASLNVIIGSSALPNAVNVDTSIVIGCNTASFSVAQTENQLILGHSSVPGILTGETNVLIGNSLGISGTQLDYDHCVIIGHLAGNDLPDDQDIFLIEQPQGNTSSLARPYLFGNMLNGNLALLNIEAMVGGVETGTRIVPAWADAAPTAGQGVFSMYGAGTDLAATTDADFVHFFVASADSTLTLRYPGGGDVTLLHDGTDVIINDNLIGLNVDGKLFLNTLTGTGPIGNIVSATPGLVSIFGAGTATNSIDGGAVEIWGGYAAGASGSPQGGRVGIWGGGGGGGEAVGGDVEIFGGSADLIPGGVTIVGGVANTSGAGGTVTLTGGAGVAQNGGQAHVVGGAGGAASGGGGFAFVTGGVSGGGAVGGGGRVLVVGGQAISTLGAGGRVDITGGEGNGAAGDGGSVFITGGEPGGGGGAGVGGNVVITGGINNGGGTGSSVSMTGGLATGTEIGGAVSMLGSAGGGAANGGAASVTAGDSGGGVTGDGGAATIESGAAVSTNGSGGDVFLTAGVGNGTGLQGKLVFDGVEEMAGADAGLTADVSSIQGGGVILSSYNVYTTVGTTGDAATLPAVFGLGTKIYVKNDGANAMDVFPASGDDLGEGANVALSVAAGQGVLFLADVANSTWTQLLASAEVGSGSFTDLLLSQAPGTHAASPTLRFGDGDTGFYESTDGTLALSNEGVANFFFSVFGLLSSNINAFGCLNGTATSTNPTLVPNRGDDDTGLGWTSSNIMTAVVGSAIAIEMTNGGDVALFQAGTEVARTDTTANGGFEVDAGEGFFRVLNLQDQEIKRVAADQGFATDITSNPVADLLSTLIVTTGEHMLVEGMLRFESASATPGVRWQLDLSGAATTDSIVAWTLIIEGGTVEGDIALADVDITHTMAAATEHVYKFMAMVEANATMVPTIAFAQNVSNATQTILKSGSWVKWTLVP